MATPLDNNYLSNFDLEFLLGPASAVGSITENAALSNYVNEVDTVNDISLPLHINNEAQNLKSDNESLKIHFAKLENDHDSLKNDYKALKKDYAKLALDYASLQKENRDHAMASINNSKKFDNMELQANQYLTTINRQKNQCELYEINIASQDSNIKQFQCLVQELTIANEELKKNIRTEKATVRDGRKMISTLNSNNETLTDHLCLLGCVIQGRRKLDRDIRRYIKKYCKKNTSPNETEESFECKSIDTGRGSSMAFSDVDRNFYSPAYSCNFSPLSTCSTILRNDQAKQMKDASSSPPPCKKTLDISTSPIMFEAIDKPTKNVTSDMLVDIVFEEARTPESKLKNSGKQISPISFNRTVLSTKTDVGINPIFVKAVKIPPETKTSQMTNISISFEKVETPMNPTKMSDMAKYSIIEDPDTPGCPSKTHKKDKHLKSDEEDKTLQHMTKSSHKAEHLLLDDGDKTPQLTVKLSNNPMNSISIVEAELPQRFSEATIGSKLTEKTKYTMTSSLNKASLSIFDDNSETPKRKTKKSEEPKSLKPAYESTSPRDMTDIVNKAKYSRFNEDLKTQHNANTLDKATGSIPAAETKNVRNSINSLNKITRFIFNEGGETPKHKMNKSDDNERLHAEEVKTPLHMTGASNGATFSIFDEDAEMPQYIAKKPDKAISSTAVVEVKNFRQTKNSANKAIHSIFDEDSVTPTHKTKKSEESTNPIPAEKAQTPRNMSNTMNTVTTSHKDPENPRHRESTFDKPLSISSKSIHENKSLQRLRKTSDTTTNSMFVEKTNIVEHTRITSDKVTDSIIDEETETLQVKTPDTPQKSVLHGEAKTQHTTEIPQITLSVFDEVPEFPRYRKTLDKLTSSIHEEEAKSEWHTTEMSEITLTSVEKVKTPLRTSVTSAIYTSPTAEYTPSRSSSAASYYSTDYEDTLLSLSECNDIATTSKSAKDEITSTDTNSKIFDKLKEIDSQASDNLQNDIESNLEIQMILDKHRLNLIMISPMSITPELDRENEPTEFENEGSIDNIEAPKTITPLRKSEISSQPIHRSDEKRNEDRIDNESCRDSHNANHLNLATSMNSESTIQRRKHDNIYKNDIPHQYSVPELSHQTSAKKPGITNNNKKLSVLQKLYQNNLPKNKIKQVHTSVQKHHRKWTPYSIPVVNNSSENLSLNKEKAVKIMAKLKDKQLISKEKVTKGKEMSSCNENVPLVPSQAGPGNVSNKECYTNIQNTPKYESGLKNSWLAIGSQANNTREVCDTQNTSLCPKNTRNPRLSKNMECEPPQTLVTPLSETGPRRSSRLSIESQSNSKCDVSHTPMNPLNQTIPRNSEYLPKLSNKKCAPPHIKTESLLEICTRRRSGIYSEKQIHNAKISQLKTLDKEAETIGKSISTAHPILPQPDNNNTKEIEGYKINPEEIDYIASPPSKKIRISHMTLLNARGSGNKKRLCISPIQQDEQGKKSNLQTVDTEYDMKSNSSPTSNNTPETGLDRPNNRNSPLILLNKSAPIEQARHCADYNDINLFLNEYDDVPQEELKKPAENLTVVKDILSTMLEKYASVTNGHYKKPIEDPTVKDVASKIDSGVSKCTKCRENQEEYKKAIAEFVSVVKSQDTKNFVNGLIKFLNDPARKADLPKVVRMKAPPIITPTEQTLIDVIIEIQGTNNNLVEDILDNIEYTLFSLDRGATPVFEIVESMAHFFAAICNYYRNLSRLRMFMLNALYCISFKAMSVIKQCLDVCPNALPYGNTVSAKSPLIRCFVFMLHFYACDDPFKRVQELRDRLKYKYYYNLLEENESTILFMFKSAIGQLTENKMEKEMLRISLIVLAKRRGTSWCHKNIVQKILLPMIRDQIQVSDTGKRFCITTLGPLLKPYKNEMIVHREEVVTLLMNMLMESQRHELKEDILTSLITIDTQTTWEPINKYLMQWTPPAVSPAFEEVLKRYIRRKHVSKWKIFYIKHYSEV